MPLSKSSAAYVKVGLYYISISVCRLCGRPNSWTTTKWCSIVFWLYIHRGAAICRWYCFVSTQLSWSYGIRIAKSTDVARNNAFTEIFNGCWRESVKLLQYCLNFLPASVLIDMHKISFWRKMFYHSNVILHSLAVECRQPLAAIANSCNILASCQMEDTV